MSDVFTFMTQLPVAQYGVFLRKYTFIVHLLLCRHSSHLP